MEKSTSDLFQIVLLVLVAAVLSINAFLFLRLQENQGEILREIRRLSPTAASVAATPGPAQGSPAPDFRLASVDGETLSLDDFSGGSVLVIFSSITCPACEKAYPAIRDFHRREGTPAVVMISRGTTAENRSLAQEKDLDMPVLEWSDEVARAYEIPGTPFGVLVERGRIARSGVISRSFLDDLST